MNLLPFQMLVMLVSFRAPLMDWARSAAAVLLASLIGWSSLFGWEAWREMIWNGRLFEFNPQGMRASFSYNDPGTGDCVRRVQAVDAGDPADAARAANYIEGSFHEPLTILDFAMNLRVADNGAVWSAVQVPENLVSVPSARRQEFLVSTANWLKRNGWLVVDRKFPAEEWVTDFQSAYRMDRTMDFGSYYAVRFVPK